jgi:phosphate transport system protein
MVLEKIMDNSKIGHHISKQFNKELEDIRTQVLIMGGLVEQQLDLALNAFTLSDFRLAEQGIKLFNKINVIKITVDHQCMETLAIRQPAAFDLRFLITVIKIIYELEMVGELAESIAKIAIQLSNAESKYDAYPEIRGLSKWVKEMLRNALNAFARINADDISIFSKPDESFERQCSSISMQLTSKMMQDPKNITRTLDILRAARAIERIGDHAIHICEEIIYMTNGEPSVHGRNMIS